MLITDIEGVFASGVHCGIKQNNQLDLAFIYVPNCVGSAVVLSQNLIRSVTPDHNQRVFESFRQSKTRQFRYQKKTGPENEYYCGTKHLERALAV